MTETKDSTLDPTERAALVERVLSLTDFSLLVRSGSSLKQGQFLVTGPQVGEKHPEKRIGFCIQVRLRCGQFGSDMVFLRHPDESLTTHENQCYIAMTDEQEQLARQLFSHLPEDQDYSQGYRCCDKVHEVGFLIEDSASQPSRGGVTMLKTTTLDESGKTSVTCSAFI